MLMNRFTLTVESLLNEEELLQQHSISIEDGQIVSIDAYEGGSENILSGTLVPGFIDVQVNGGGGFLFNESPTLDSLKQIGYAHQQFGTTGWLPTLVTDNIEQMHLAADAVAEAMRQKVPGILGIHFEGPHLSVKKRGVHQEHLIRQLDKSEKELFVRSDIGKVVVTLAPENVSPELISELVAEGVIICLGHSNATFEQTQKALDAGATGFTHLYNAMSAFSSREPGMVGAALLDKDSFAGLILDGVHVHPQAAKLAIQTKPNIMLVTDAMPPVGSAKDSFEFFGQTILRDGDTLRDDEGRLAGSVLDMASAVRNCSKLLSLSLPQASKLASLNPAKFLGIDTEFGSLAVGKKANMVLLNKQGVVIANWIDGKQVFSTNLVS
jgi:N-acetylglucosamine-6-phosphate deacetylase